MTRIKPFDAIELPQIQTWLENHHGAPIEALERLHGGYWSSAFAYSLGDARRVLRLSDGAEGFRMDADAMQFAPALPVPEIFALGTAFGGHYAISRYHEGVILEDIPLHGAHQLAITVQQLLAALRKASPAGTELYWSPAAGEGPPNWQALLWQGLKDSPHARWHQRIESDPRLRTIFRACLETIERLLPACPERRDLIHGDLLHRNVLVKPDASAVTAIFSWKCSFRGDFLYDVAWCSLWGRRYPALAGAEVFRRTLDAGDLREADLEDAALRHHCYVLQIAASHFGWYVRTGETEELALLAGVTEELLERGPAG